MKSFVLYVVGGALLAVFAYFGGWILAGIIDDKRPPQELDIAAAKASIARRKVKRELTPHEEQI